MKILFFHWIKANRTLLINSGSLISTTLVTSGLGFAYWWLAARLFPPEAVGLASAAISAMMLLATISLLGWGNLLINELPRQAGHEQALISTAALLTGGVGGFIGIIFALSTSFISQDLQALKTSLGNMALFASGVSLTAIAFVVDQACIGLLRSGVQLWRNALFAATKLVALLGAGLYLSYKVGLTIYSTWALGNVFSLVVVLGFVLIKGRLSLRSCFPQKGVLHQLRHAALQHHILNLAIMTPTLVLPVIVTIMLSARVNGWFYISFTLASFLSSVLYALTTVLNAMNAAEPTKLTQQIRLTVSLSLTISIVANCLLLSGAGYILGLFGPTYAEQATQSLYILGLGTFPVIIKDHYIAVCRIHRRMASALIPVAIGGLLELAGPVLGALIGGLAGLSLGWVLAMVIEALYMSPTVYRAASTSQNKNVAGVQPASDYQA